MPRGVKKIVSIDEKISAKEAEIIKLEEDLKSAKADLKSLKKEKEDEDLKNLYEAVKASGKTIEEILAMLAPTE